MIVIVRNRTTGSTETFLNVERIESNSKDDGASAFTISLTDYKMTVLDTILLVE